MTADDTNRPDEEIEHRLKTEAELLEEYRKLRHHLSVFWMYRPRNVALTTAFPSTVQALDRRVTFLEDVLQIPESDRFDYEEVDQREID